MKQNPDADPETPPEHTGWLATVLSVAASFFGVQSSENRKRDFTRGKPLHFIFVAVLMTVLFIGTVLLAVRFALHSAGM